MLLDIAPGPWLLSSPSPGLSTHRSRYGGVPALGADQLVDLADRHAVLGRGGAGFPFALKLRAVVQRKARRRHVVVNLSEGEPASAKDAALAVTAPHLILDGAALTAAALGVAVVHLVTPDERGYVTSALTRAIAERENVGEGDPAWQLHVADHRFVSGEASAVTELIDGRPNLPVTSWQPTALKGIAGQPTFLSNAETFAQLAALAHARGPVPGTAVEPGSRLLSITRGNRVRVEEVVHGARWSQVLTAQELDSPILIGGYHGQWVPPSSLAEEVVSAEAMRARGLALGAGVVIPLPPGSCGLSYTAQITQYLARQSAGRCGPCINGLPALATAFSDLAAGRPGADLGALAGLLRGRGACAHPDGTVRLVMSAATTFAEEILAHQRGSCVVTAREVPRSPAATGSGSRFEKLG